MLVMESSIVIKVKYGETLRRLNARVADDKLEKRTMISAAYALNDVDYIRMDFPRDIFRGCGVKSPKLDSRFTQDVNVLDGTVMAPLTPFTKVWRMRNNGNIFWPQGTQLVWIGGDRLSDAFSVELQITSVGLAVDHELDVAVDFTAPQLPGRYISYWRMALPSGQKFGQRVWVLIQVDFSMTSPKKEFFYEASEDLDLDLNFPPVSNGIVGSETINANADMSMEDIIPDPKISNPTVELLVHQFHIPLIYLRQHQQLLLDPILEELEEMVNVVGFCNKEMNKKLLKKNNGNIKRVVMDLIAGEH
ncbi:hypothetical protein HAX54_012904 [Datura stramonium]|uniref:Next to BRCA1 central domain-containing protein n=1 Tax=Datura stramonium TaxID=4076 RepID=A0ABS8RYG4_DATST|nr:hypothetical protein [Datura stramonium]